MSRPRAWLGAQMALVLVLGALVGWWTVIMAADSASYLQAAAMGWPEVLTAERSVGYPLILRVVQLVSPDLALAPLAHALLVFAAVFTLHEGLRRYGAPEWTAFAGASAFLYGTLQHKNLVSHVLTDAPAMATAGMTAGFLLMVVASPRSVWGWAGLVLATAATWEIRPAHMQIVGVVPVAGAGLLWLRTRSFAGWRVVLGLAAASVLPLLAWCALRLAVVGHFGVVSYGGYALCGMGVELMDREMLEARPLPADLQPLADQIMARKDEEDLPPAFSGRFGVDMYRYDENYSTNIFVIAVPAAEAVYGGDNVAVDSALTRISREAMARDRAHWLSWGARTYPRAVAKLLYRSKVLWLLSPLAALAVLRGRRSVSAATMGLSALAVLFFVGHETLLVYAGAYGDSRYVVAAGMFVPTALAMLAADQRPST